MIKAQQQVESVSLPYLSQSLKFLGLVIDVRGDEPRCWWLALESLGWVWKCNF